MKGIILAGGAGTRLYPLTKVMSKQLLPVYDKPMIYYPLSVLMLAGIKEIMIITTPKDLSYFKELLGEGDQFGVRLTYAVQPNPEGIAQALLIGEEFIGHDTCALILGDNIFYGNDLTTKLFEAKFNASSGDATVFSTYVSDPERFGVIEFDYDGKIHSIEEKPAYPKSNYAVTGLYFYPENVSKMAAEIKPSKRGELEITELNQKYLEQSRLHVQLLGRGFSWFDTGTPQSLFKAGAFVEMIQSQQGIVIAAPEEIAYMNGWINKDKLGQSLEKYGKSQYGEHLRSVYLDEIIH